MRGSGRPNLWRTVSRRAANLLARLRNNRRGAVAVGFGVTVVGFLGLAGIATEAGYWYSAHRKGQNAADAAALAAATEADKGVSDSNARGTGLASAQRNGFTSGLCSYTGSVRVCINKLTTGSYSSSSPGWEAIVDQVQTITFARIFGITSKTVSSRAVAAIQQSGPACVLSLSDTLKITGAFTVTANDCVFASNKKGADSIDTRGNSSIHALMLNASGQCDNCDDTDNVIPPTTYTEYGRDTTNPFVALDSVSWPGFHGTSQCQDYPANGGTLSPYTATNQKAYCTDLHLSNSTDAFVLVPGTYVFYNANFIVNNGSVTCHCNASGSGVSIVLLGNGGSVGSIDINATATVTLNAGTNTTALNANLAGVLFYRQDARDDLGTSGYEVAINGGATTVLQGGFYFPRADGKYNGNATSTCTVIVGGSIMMNGDATFSTDHCSDMGTGTGRIRSVALVE